MNEAIPGPEPGLESTSFPAPGPGAGAIADAVRREVPPPGDETRPVPVWAWGLLALVFAMRALDLADVWLMASVLPSVQAGWLATLLIFAVAGPAAGYLADRFRRPRLLAISFAAWSLAVVATGLARSDVQIQAARVVAGIGGSAATVITLTLLADAFPRRMRGRAFAAFFLAILAGAPLGLLLATAFPPVAVRPTAFLALGAPGLALALLALIVAETVRGASEPVDEGRLRLHEQVGPSQEDYIDLMVNSSFNYSVFGMAFSSFALAGLAYWLPAFLDVKGMEAEHAKRLSIVILLAAAGVGTAIGGWLADAFGMTRPRRLFLLPGLAILAAIPCMLLTIYGHAPRMVESGTFLAEYAMFLVVPPCFTILAGVTMPNMRGVGFGVALAASHVLGDLWSPTLMGWVIDTFAQADSMATEFGHFLAAIGAVPITQPGHDPENLTAGMLVLLPALLVAGIVLLAGVRHLPRELALMIAKLRAVPSRRR